MSNKKNPGVKKNNDEIEYTKEMMQELLRCANDPVYFIRNYVYIKHPKRGRIKFDLYDYQEEMIKKFKSQRYNIVLSSRQTGKCLFSATILNTIIINDCLFDKIMIKLLNFLGK